MYGPLSTQFYDADKPHADPAEIAWYDEAQIRALLEGVGFEDITIEPAAYATAEERAFGVSARAR